MAEFDYAKAAMGMAQGIPPAATDGGGFDFAKAAQQLAAPAPPVTPRLTEDPSRSAGAGTIAGASLAEKPQAQIRWYAKARGIPEDRYKVVEGRIAYQGDDGNFYPEVPGGWSPSQLLKRGAQGIGPSIPAVPAAAVGLLTAPAMLAGPPGLALSVGATGLTAAAGQSVREQLADMMMDQPKSGMRVFREGATAGLGQGLGAGLNAWSQRYQTADIGKYTAEQARDATDTVAKARGMGIELTPAEATNLASLKAQQKYLGNAPASQNTMEEFYARRGEQVSQAVQRFLDRVSPVDSAEVAGRMGQGAAQGAIDQGVDAAQRQARPWYRAAMTQQGMEVNPAAVVSYIDDRLATAKGEVANVLQQARGYLTGPARSVQVPIDEAGSTVRNLDTRIAGLHDAKLAIDALIDARGEKAISATAKHELEQVKKLLVGALSDASPEYGNAMRIFGRGMKPVEQLKEGVVGTLAETDPARFGTMARSLFGANSGPRAIGEARDALSKANPEAWQALKRSWLQDVFEKSSTEYASNYGGTVNVAGKFAAATRGNLQTWARIQAALDPAEATAFRELTDVLQRAGRVKPIGSDTEFNRLITEAMQDQARGPLTKIIRNANPAALLRNFDTWITGRNLAASAEDLANIITKPDALQTLRQIKLMSPGSAKFRVAVGHLLSQATEAGAASVLDPMTEK